MKKNQFVPAPKGMPTKLRICDQDWQIRYSTDLAKMERPAYGMTIPDARTIILDPSHDRSVMQSTLLHELMHACAAMPGIRIVKQKHEENAILQIEPALLSALRSNPPWWT